MQFEKSIENVSVIYSFYFYYVLMMKLVIMYKECLHLQFGRPKIKLDDLSF